METKTFKSNEWQEELNQIPNLERLMKLRAEIEELNFESMLLEEIQKEYYKRFNLLPFSGTFIPKKDINKLTIFRVRKNITEHEYPLLANVYNYPPSNILKSNGRANIKFRPVFYGALDAETAFWESDPQINDKINVSLWSINSQQDIFATFILPLTIHQGNRLVPILQKHRELQIEQLKDSSGHKLNELLFITDMISEWLKDERKPYSKASWIAYKYLYEYNGISFLFYPSAATSSKTSCIA